MVFEEPNITEYGEQLDRWKLFEEMTDSSFRTYFLRYKCRLLLLSEHSRGEGILAIESRLSQTLISIGDPLENALQYCVDGAEEDFVDKRIDGLFMANVEAAYAFRDTLKNSSLTAETAKQIQYRKLLYEVAKHGSAFVGKRFDTLEKIIDDLYPRSFWYDDVLRIHPHCRSEHEEGT